MERLNYQHLYYFWIVAKAGSIKNACEILGLAQPTISGQLSSFERAVGAKVFKREGRKLVLNENGWLVFNYADEIFSIGDELKSWLKGESAERRRSLKIGICHNVDTQVALHLLSPALNAPDPAKISCFSGDAERLAMELRLRTFDLAIIVGDSAPADNSILSSRLLGALEISLFSSPATVKKYRAGFPKSLHRAPMILPIRNSSLRQSLDRWLQAQGVQPDLKAEIADRELLLSVAARFDGLVFAPTIAQQDIRRRYGLRCVGAIKGVEERVYAVTIQQMARNPAIAQIIGSIEIR